MDEASVVSTISNSASWSWEILAVEMVGEGVRGKTGLGMRTGNVVVGLEGEDDDEDEEGGVDDEPATGVGAGSPWATSSFMTASHPFSRVLMRSLSSAFSLSRAFSRSCSSMLCLTSARWNAERVKPARSCLFSSSSSATRRARRLNSALRLSREF